VTQDHSAHAAVIVDQLVAIDVEQIRPLAAREHQRPARHANAEIAVDAAGNVLGILCDQRRGAVERQ